MLSFVSEWLLVVEVSWTSDGEAVDGGSLCGLLRRSPSSGFLIVESVFRRPAEPRRVELLLAVTECYAPDLFSLS